MVDIDVYLEWDLPATLAQVMEQISREENIQKWTGEEAIFPLESGAEIRLFDNWVSGKLISLGKDELKMSWRCADWIEDMPDSQVQIRLKEKAGMTQLLLKHTGLYNEEQVGIQRSAWQDFYLTPLEDYLMILYNR